MQISRRDDGKFIIPLYSLVSGRGIKAGDTFTYKGKRYEVSTSDSVYNGYVTYICDAFEINN